MLTEDQQKMSKLAQYGVRRLYPKALCDLKPLIPDLTVSGIQTPGSKQIARQLVTLPTHQGIKKQLALRIADHAAKMFGDVLLVV
jgi:dTDP-4-amino-4,6-dideoxygalactose transaminase